MASPYSSTVLRWAHGLRFPVLFMITAGVFLVDLLLPDPIPLVDEVLIGLVTLVLASWKRRKVGREMEAAASGQTRIVADYPQEPGQAGPGQAAPPPLPDHANPR